MSLPTADGDSQSEGGLRQMWARLEERLADQRRAAWLVPPGVVRAAADSGEAGQCQAKGWSVFRAGAAGRAMPALAPQAAVAPREKAPGRGRIMVVDDDEVVRSTMCDLIRTLGYEVEAMPDGLAAVEVFLQDPHAWDLILLDLMMPRMDGMEALRRIRARRADQPVLVVTGFAGEQNVRRLEQIARVPLLMKPIQIRELSRWIADLVH